MTRIETASINIDNELKAVIKAISTIEKQSNSETPNLNSALEYYKERLSQLKVVASLLTELE